MAARIVTRLHRVLSEKMKHRGPPQEWVADRKGIYTPGAVAPMFFNVTTHKGPAPPPPRVEGVTWANRPRDPKTFLFVILALPSEVVALQSSDGSTFRWVALPDLSLFRWVALPMGRPSDGSPSLRASLAPLNVRRRMRLGRHC